MCLRNQRLAILHMHYMQSDKVDWADSPPSSTLWEARDNTANILTACLTVPHALLCYCVSLAWQPKSQ